VFHQDNARPHVSLITRQKLLELGWDVLPHPPYSSDLAPSDFHLFRSLQNSLNGKSFNSLVEVKNYLEKFFAENLRDSGRNFQVAWKMEKDCRTEWHLYNLINVY